jgi:hypothetical protein
MDSRHQEQNREDGNGRNGQAGLLQIMLLNFFILFS